MKKTLPKLFLISIIIIGLLVIQALCDLELPNYTSDIINYGIQSNGITKNIPEVIPESLFNVIVKVSKEDKAILASYDLVVKDNLSKTDFEKYSKKYNVLKKENIYLLRNLNDKELDLLEKHLTNPLIISTMFEANNESLITFLNVELEDGEKLSDWLMSLDDDNFNMEVKNVNAMINSQDDTVINNFGLLCIKEIYNISGIDLNNYQMNYIIHEGLIMLSIALIGMIIAIIVGYLTSKLASFIGYILRYKLLVK